jgi:hypothetical protein
MAIPVHQRPYLVAEHILSCAQSGLADSSGGSPSKACVVTGEVAYDACECGQLMVSMARTFPSVTFPEQNIGTGTAQQAKCGAPYIVVEYNVVMLRCAPMIGEGTTEIDIPCDKLTASAMEVMEDASIIRAEVFCCLKDLSRTPTPEGLKISNFLVGEQTATGPEGGCVGTSLNVMIALNNMCGCG